MASAFCVQSSVTTSASSLLTKSSSLSQLTPAVTKSQSSFFGTSLPEAGLVSGAIDNSACKGSSTIRLPAIRARTAGASKTIEVEVDKPLGLTLGQKSGGGVVITAVDGGGNAAKAGLKAGDQVIYTSSFFGDELWPADKLGFTKTAIQAKPESVYFVVSRGAEIDVKRLPKRPAPPRFGRKLTEAQKARATHICLDCGYIYTLTKPFDEQPEGFKCPQCAAPKKRFAEYDPETGQAIGGNAPPLSVILGILVSVAAIGALVFYSTQ
ncbi:hypothetical protein GOP47_0016357 [Adiantum capillus-veneris]|uniref:Rubredoxin family protein n=1 Tax=Adiantum capillus-veneris TaxID=13818 RepID=A0A9D4UHY0_ADICA|nr:hypothetical protein GOP47_0016357 [Adiantum capillus-veneris]